MTAPTLTPGDRYLDNCGREWTVDQHGGLEHHAAGGVLRRAWHSLDACAGPLQPVHDQPQPGDKYRDCDGDTWTVLADGDLIWDQSPESISPLVMSMEEVDDEHGPLTKIERDEDRPSNVVELPAADAEADPVNHPSHYKSHPSGVECITVTEHMNFCIGNAVKYLWRAGLKNDAIEDLRKAEFYIRREIERRENEARQQLDAA